MPSDWKVQDIEFVTWSMRDADFPRSRRRALIDALANGVPPFTEKEVQENGISVNVNDLSAPRALHDARAQFNSAFMKPGAYFNCVTDAGAKHKRMGYGRTVTNLAAKTMKKSLSYFECHRSKWAMTVLHGIAPCVFQDADCVFPRPIGIDNVYVPGNTELVMDGLPFFPIYRQFTAPQLIRLAKGPVKDPAWNQELVDACLKWIDEQTLRLGGNYWPDYWQPEKWEERLKSDGACYATDSAPTVNVFDFYYWDDSKKQSGWRRKMILDAWSMPSATGARTRLSGGPFDNKDQFLYNPENRIWASDREHIITWQFADLSAVAPFHYHSVRSLGYLLYSVCHLQNRLRCKVNEAIFEQLMVLMRIKSQDDMQRALSVNLVNRGFVDESVDFIKAGDRYQVNAQLAQMGLMENANLINRNSSSFTAKTPSQSGDGGRPPTATQWLGEEARVTQLVSAGLMQAYEYQKPEYREIFRRLTKKHSTDPDAQRFQAKCLKEGVPEKVLYTIDSWEIEPERVMGSGNKTLEMMVSDWLVNHIQMYEPDAQNRIKQIATLSVTDDAALTAMLVPERPATSSSVHDAQLAIGTLLVGQPMELKQNVSHVEYAQALIDALGVEIAKAQATGGVTDQAHIMGMMNLAGQSIDGQPIPGNGAANHIAIVAQDEQQKDIAKVLGDQLGKLMNEVKAFAQRFQEQQQAAAEQNGGLDAETQAKIQADLMMAEAKAANTRDSHAARTAQRQVAFEMEQERKNAETAANIARENARFTQELQQDAVKTVAEIETQKAKALTGKGEKG